MLDSSEGAGKKDGIVNNKILSTYRVTRNQEARIIRMSPKVASARILFRAF